MAPPGDPTRFDMLGALDEITAFAGTGARVVEIEASNVRADGTIDLTQLVGWTEMEYTFLREVPAPADPPPVGAGGSLDGKYHQQVDVTVSKPGRWIQTTTNGKFRNLSRHLGMEREEGSILPGALPADLPAKPTCRVADLWERIPGIPAGAVAFVDWDGAYEISVSDTNFSGEFDTFCRPPAEDPVPTPRPTPPERPNRPKVPGKAKARPRR